MFVKKIPIVSFVGPRWLQLFVGDPEKSTQSPFFSTPLPSPSASIMFT